MGPMCWFHGLHCLGVLGKIGDPPLNAGHDVAIAGGMQTDHEVDRLCQERTWIHKLEELQEGYERKDLAKKVKATWEHYFGTPTSSNRVKTC